MKAAVRKGRSLHLFRSEQLTWVQLTWASLSESLKFQPLGETLRPGCGKIHGPGCLPKLTTYRLKVNRLIESRDHDLDVGSPQRLGKGTKIGLSLLVVLHVWAIAAPPLAFQTRGPLGGSPSVATLTAPVRGYGEFLYLNRGYAFFAPDPGPSHLIQAAYVDAVGNPAEEMFPDLDHQWPRLLYHRHFMLSEFLHEIYQPPGPPPGLGEVDANAARAWSAARGRYESVRVSYVNHLTTSREGSRDLAIRRLEHRIPSFVEFASRSLPLQDSSYYGVLLDRVPDLGESGQLGGPIAPEVLSTDAAPELDRVGGDDVITHTLPSEVPSPGTPLPGTPVAPNLATPDLATPQESDVPQ